MPWAIHYTSDTGADALYIVLEARHPRDAVASARSVLGICLSRVDKVVPMTYTP